MLRRYGFIVLIALSISSTGFAQDLQDQSDQPAQVDQTAQAAQPVDTAQAAQAPKQPPVQEPDQVVRPVETASTQSTVRKILTNFWHDQKGIWTSPAHINRDNAKWWGLFGVGTAALIATDRDTSNRLPNTLTQISFSKRISQIGADYTTLPIAAGLYFYGRATDKPKAREVGVLGAQTLLDSAITVEILKKIFGRERPELEGGNGRFFKGKDGFPSGHAIEIWSFASLISHEYAPSKIVPIVTYSFATAVSVSRFTARKHYASDILAGGAMGWFIGRYVFRQHLDPNIHKRYNPPIALAPFANPVTHSYGVSVAWAR
jgi:membrane-associated phospholipid phosphatase